MKRRQFMSLAMTALGAFSVPLTTRAFAQATQGIAPIGIAVANSPRGRLVTRVYPGRQRRELVMMIRSPEGDEFRRMTLPAGIARLGRRFLQEGTMPLRVVDINEDSVDLDFRMSGEAPNISFEYRMGDWRGSGMAAGDDEDAPGGGGGTTQGLSPLGFLLAVFAMAFALAAYAIHEGASLKLRFRCDTGFEPGCESEIQVGNPMDEGEGDNFIADESCEGLPPLPC